MQVELTAVLPVEKETLRNLLEKYNYEFSQYDLIPFNEEGLYGYRYLDSYFTQPDRAAWFIRADRHLAGFVLVNRHPDCGRPLDWAVAEFFVAYPFRRRGVGIAAMAEIFRRFKGNWQIKYHPRNEASAAFWQAVAERAAAGAVENVPGDSPYQDGSEARVLCFCVE